MRIIPFLLSAAVAIGLVIVLDTKIGSVPPLGKLLSPSHGLWKNAEPDDFSFSANVISGELRQPVSVYLDERLVPHVFAKNDHDAYLVQGYLHAKFRLWQMDFQSYAAAGRLSEILGEKLGESNVLQGHDRKFRRLGMVYAAENALKELTPEIRDDLDAYASGVNAYIRTLNPEDYPIEYKLLNYKPEPWTPLKSALIYKYMSYDLTADLDDFDYTNVRLQLGLPAYDLAFPLRPDSVSPIVPKGTIFTATRPLPVKPPGVDSLLQLDSANRIAINTNNRDIDNGSNNWVIAGIKTASGKPILCNDLHLGLNLPSLWYEIQINTPDYNTYGVSLPGAPSIVIGFNDSIAWGVTNASRDVMDFYEMKFKDTTMNEYWYDSAWQKTQWRNEIINIKGQPAFTDRIAMTIWGPVMYDHHYPTGINNGKYYALKWTAHDPSQDFGVFMNLDRAKNYSDFLAAISHFSNPAQNFIYASKKNTIALWQMGALPAKWKGQGDFIMPGWDSTYQWQGFIPFYDKIHEVNPERGYLSSANQLPADTNYPYYLGGSYDLYRSLIINRTLGKLDSTTTIKDMQKMQTSNYNIFAEFARPVLLRHLQGQPLTPEARLLLSTFTAWNLTADADEKGQTIFDTWWNNFRDTIWQNNVDAASPAKIPVIADHVLLEALMHDSLPFMFADNLTTPAVETVSEMVVASLNKTALKFKDKVPVWADYRDARLTHLLRIPAFNDLHLQVGGGPKIINCIKKEHGPSWRMIVQLTDETEAYGVYPGGQQGNPGSKYYLQFADTWAAGKYYRLWLMKPGEKNSDHVKWRLEFRKA